MEQESKQRSVELDMTKGIGIIMVVAAHANAPISVYIELFHMPLFFFVSGMLFDPFKTDAFSYIKRKMQTLLCPFWGWNLLLFPLFYVLYYWKSWRAGDFVLWILKILITVDKVPFLGATWFLMALFWVSVFIKTIYASFAKRGGVAADGALILAGLLMLIFGFSFTLPYRLSRVFVFGSFYVWGYFWQRYRKYLPACIGQYGVLGCLVACALFWCAAQRSAAGIVLWGRAPFTDVLLFLVVAFSGIFVTLSICHLFERETPKNVLVKHLAFLGKHTLPIVIWHFLAFRLTILVQIVFCGGTWKALTSFPTYVDGNGWWILYTVTGLYGSLIWDALLRHSAVADPLKRIHML